MLRIRAVQSLLIEDVAGLMVGEAGEGEDPLEPAREALGRAGRRALAVAALWWGALVVLLLFHPGPARFLAFGGVETVFTLGTLAVATAAGFRLGQWEKYRAVTRAVEELEEREG